LDGRRDALFILGKPIKLGSLLSTPSSAARSSDAVDSLRLAPAAVDSLDSDLAEPHRHLNLIPGEPSVRLEHFALSLSL
jgi:hypothetical protein